MKVPGDILKHEDEIRARVAELGARISSDYAGREISMLGVLGGAFVFMADLVRRIEVPVRCGFVEIRASRRSELMTEIAFTSSFDVTGKDLLLVKDILDTGITMAYLCQQLMLRQPRSLRLCALIDKPQRRKIDMSPDYCGFQAPDRYVVGYGLDLEGQYQNLPHLACLEPARVEGVPA
ncbi:MAG: hypoxanthine phosphoribosyltransferase [Gemmatimonadetes bacterium]|nr:hypoxanthine phosphoribosyltransferase [Gemmatimonadota bacterium]